MYLCNRFHTWNLKLSDRSIKVLEYLVNPSLSFDYHKEVEVTSIKEIIAPTGHNGWGGGGGGI